ncbi:carboxypeptidase regulatory-like domain-containing protein [Psychroflexus sp. YR1-1]|uniref:Carboxypeptidase regulatory-like domain-containing protein n=1 Tax=Psychroflexus aurantiacus TaxID=2709310 RepID=A0A6B3R119_9FLAO|nr:carboxypeptidase-like regulatory domain-containing protein [Psychroflexus aurantiacus]NEV94316.1 carboxypeptidase regulatory-like domain-containing protein [Psychroflexus aurantiacus]
MKKLAFILLSLAFISCGNDSNLLDGKVTNASGAPVENVLVQVMGTDLNSTTDAKGEFRINTKNRGDELILTHPDYQMSRIDIGDNSEISIELKEKKSQEQQK